MVHESIRNKIKRIKIHTKRLMFGSLTGDYLSAFKGSGLEFHQIRDYQFGDDIRAIDWNSSAKNNKLMIKQFIEERDRTIILAIDISASGKYSSQHELRKDLTAQVAGTLALVAGANKDRVGALFFSDKIEKWLAPNRGASHAGKILETIFSLQATSPKTNIAEALRFLISLKKRNAIVFMISDWIDDLEQYSNFIKVARYKYDFVGIRISDPCEEYFPDIGLLEIQDPETGERNIFNTKKHALCTTVLQARLIEQKRLFEKNKMDLVCLTVGQPFVNTLLSFFHQRIRRQI